MFLKSFSSRLFFSLIVGGKKIMKFFGGKKIIFLFEATKFWRFQKRN